MLEGTVWSGWVSGVLKTSIHNCKWHHDIQRKNKNTAQHKHTGC
jgi:hypothetical protein